MPNINQRQQEQEVCMAEIKKDVGYIKVDIKAIKDKLDAFIESAPNRFAHKNVEEDLACLKKDFNESKVINAKYLGGAIVIVAVIQILITVVLKHFGAL